MAINDILRRATPSIQWMYDKRMDVYEVVETVKVNGADAVEFQKVYAAVPCRVSVRSLKNTEQNEARLLKTEHKIFCDPEYVIRAGSRLVVDGVEYLASEDAMVYVTHQELVVVRHEWL